MNNISVNYQNVQPTLANYFSTNNAAFQNVVNTVADSLYYNSQQFTCPAQPSTIIPCPFVTPNTNCMGSYVPEFAQNFCNNTAFGSASNLIST